MLKTFKKMQKIITRITNYIAHLSTAYDLSISFHLYGDFTVLLLNTESLRQYNNHLNPYCMYIKSNPGYYRKCLRCQQYTLKKCQQQETFAGICHAGVKELIYGIQHNDRAIGFISVSGYASDRSHNLRQLPKNDYFYRTHIKNQEPPRELCDTLIPPLIMMLETLCHSWYASSQTATQLLDENQLFNRQLLTYISQHYLHLTLSELADSFHKSKSSISHSFKQDNGITLKSYCNRLKINDAKALLQTTNLPVTDIAYTVGFESLSYFITVFKKLNGCSPLQYRKELTLQPPESHES